MFSHLEGKVWEWTDYTFHRNSGFGFGLTINNDPHLAAFGRVGVRIAGPTLDVFVDVDGKVERSYKGLNVVAHTIDHKAGTEAIVAIGEVNGKAVTCAVTIDYNTYEGGYAKMALSA